MFATVCQSLQTNYGHLNVDVRNLVLFFSQRHVSRRLLPYFFHAKNNLHSFAHSPLECISACSTPSCDQAELALSIKSDRRFKQMDAFTRQKKAGRGTMPEDPGNGRPTWPRTMQDSQTMLAFHNYPLLRHDLNSDCQHSWFKS